MLELVFGGRIGLETKMRELNTHFLLILFYIRNEISSQKRAISADNNPQLFQWFL